MMSSYSLYAAIMVAVFSLASAQGPVPDRYQQIGNELGQFQSSIGKLRHDNTVKAYQLSSAAQAYDAVLSTAIPELRVAGFENLTPEGAKQHSQNIEQYVDILLNDNVRLHAEAYEAAANEAAAHQAQADPQSLPPAYQAQNARPNNVLAATGVPAFRNKAVVKDESVSTTTNAPSSTSSSSTENAEGSKSESKESKSEAKSESRESKSESKSDSRLSKSEHGAAANASVTAPVGAAASSNSTETTTHTKEHKSENNAVAYGISGGALIAGAMLALA